MLPPDRSTSYLPVILIGQDNKAGPHSPSLRGSLFLPINQTEKEGIRYFCTDQFVPHCQVLIHSIQEKGHVPSYPGTRLAQDLQVFPGTEQEIVRHPWIAGEGTTQPTSPLTTTRKTHIES